MPWMIHPYATWYWARYETVRDGRKGEEGFASASQINASFLVLGTSTNHFTTRPSVWCCFSMMLWGLEQPPYPFRDSPMLPFDIPRKLHIKKKITQKQPDPPPFRYQYGSKLHNFSPEEAPYPLSFDKDTLDLWASFCKLLYFRGIIRSLTIGLDRL